MTAVTEGGAQQPVIEIDAALVADALALAVDDFRHQVEAGHIRQLCERGTGADAGTWRASFYHRGRRARFVVDSSGRVLHAG